jgi:leader peptidase (prepilin peptidase) / N-methyltransferase
MVGVLPTAAWAVLAGLLGLAIGSFLNVVIYRVPAGMSVVSPPSRCPKCGSLIRNRHNVPVLGWLVLRGRCADCAAPISPRYPLVEAATGVLFAGLTAGLIATGAAWAVPAYLVLAAAVLTLAMIAVDGHPAPRSIVVASYPAVAALLILASAARHEWWPLGWAVLGAAVLSGTVAWSARVGRASVSLAAVAGLVGAGIGYLPW